MQKVDPNIIEILTISKLITLYSFDEKLQQWVSSFYDIGLFSVLLKRKKKMWKEHYLSLKGWNLCLLYVVVEVLVLFFRTVNPFYQIFILNMRNPQNFVEDITEDFQIENREPYVFYRNSKKQTFGIWFTSSDERRIVYDLLQK